MVAEDEYHVEADVPVIRQSWLQDCILHQRSPLSHKPPVSHRSAPASSNKRIKADKVLRCKLKPACPSTPVTGSDTKAHAVAGMNVYTAHSDVRLQLAGVPRVGKVLSAVKAPGVKTSPSASGGFHSLCWCSHAHVLRQACALMGGVVQGTHTALPGSCTLYTLSTFEGAPSSFGGCGEEGGEVLRFRCTKSEPDESLFRPKGCCFRV